MDSSAAVAERRSRIARGWTLDRGAVLVASGLPLPIAGTDQFHEFHAHPEFRYLAGIAEPASVLAFDPGEGWALFVALPAFEDRIWTGDGPDIDRLEAAAGLPVQPIERLAGWLEARRGEPLAILGNRDLADRPAGYRLPPLDRFEAVFDDDLAARLSWHVSEARRAKDPAELDAMRRAAEASRAGHLLALRTARPGMTERGLQVELEAEFFRHGADRTAYGSIVGTGPNGAILHFSPTRRELREGDLVLIDAGAEVDGYASDVTRTFPAGPRFEGIQRDLYQLVHVVQRAAIEEARPGVEYRDLHLRACERIAAGLVDLGILRGAPADLVEADAHALFFPHGLGHLLGLATHDAGGCLQGRTPSDRFGLKWLRADLPLQPGYVVTIEPGIYVIPAILDDPARRERYHDAVDWERVDALRGFGGIRIEDDILVTEGAPEVLTAALPSDIASIEALRSEAIAR
ncbi:aminopeptidase P family protein [Tepidiforma sp.]|jgi:Xaa-Pro aminopeptidase|uniref:aminopeptidase P family protein n=1 Tax=Tepidiforma sp. TaxID=2682230 RepID=UPI00260626D8|nr:aminopeptidase P family protein [Tepidiforma sp.]MCX7618101.1 aminopeptidase P family protein [Tepidiforma sp.]